MLKEVQAKEINHIKSGSEKALGEWEHAQSQFEGFSLQRETNFTHGIP